MRRAFTLIELLVIVAIIATMTLVGTLSIQEGRQGAQVRGAARDIYAAISNARSRAIVTGNRVVVNFRNEKTDEESAIQVDVDSALVMKTGIDRSKVQNYFITDYRDLSRPAEDAEKTDSESGDGGETIEEILFSPMSSSVVKGMCLKFRKGEDIDDSLTEVQRQSGISVYSTADYWIQKYAEAKGTATNATTAAASPEKSDAGGKIPDPFDAEDSGVVIWETNGSVEPHRIWIYPEGTKPEDGMMISVDRFGGIKVLRGGEKDEED